MKKPKLLVKLIWDEEAKAHKVQSTGEVIERPLIIGNIQSSFANEFPMKEMDEVARKYEAMRPNAYAISMLIEDFKGNWSDGAPFVNLYAFQLYRIPPRAFKEAKDALPDYVAIRFGIERKK